MSSESVRVLAVISYYHKVRGVCVSQFVGANVNDCLRQFEASGFSEGVDSPFVVHIIKYPFPQSELDYYGQYKFTERKRDVVQFYN